MNQRIQFVVSVPRIDGVPVARWQAYIDEAVRSWAGQFEPAGSHDAPYAGGARSEGDPMGPPCEWNKLIEVRRLR